MNLKKALAIMGVLAVASSAQATTVYDITSDHADGGLGTPPFGTVSLTQSGTTVDVTVHLNSGYWFVLTGSADFQDFKFNATGVAVSDITVDQNAPASAGTLVASTGTYNGDGTGHFVFGIHGDAQKNGGAGKFNTDITFHVADATIADLTQPNNLGILFVADLLSDFTGKTGPADVTPPTTRVPDGGATVALLGLGLLGLGAVRRKLS